VTRLPGTARPGRQAGVTVTSAAAALLLCACTSLVTTAAPGTTDPPSTTTTPRSRTATASPDATETPRFTVTHEESHTRWASVITRAIGGLDVSVSVGIGRRIVYAHLGDRPRVLASNEKLLTSMAALDLLDASYRFPTRAATDARTRDGVLRGDIWLVGGGDPTLTPDDLARLATGVRDAGVSRIAGDVIGDTATFDRGWWAPGWLRGISRDYVTRPTALRLEGGDASPEPEATAAFVTALHAAGVSVQGAARIGRAPSDLRNVATEWSPALHSLLVQQNHESDNLYAELTTKALGDVEGGEASTAGGAAVIVRWARRLGVHSGVRDGSGLSDQDRTSSTGVVTLLLAAQQHSWFAALERSLPTGGSGTLSSRLVGVPVHAKTGTLFIRPASTLSGYVRSAAGKTVAFSVLTHDLPESAAIRIEDTVARTLAAADIS
jgi:serine-type D-Ala-D-Ala carboxypeptidase/endopeptidase (penicillin-binding protein 4)